MGLLRSDIQDLKRKAADLAEDLNALEALLGVDVPSSLNKIRFITEKVLQGLCRSKGISWGQAEPTLERMIGPLVAADCIPKNVALYVRTVQMNTSPGSHYQESPLSESHVVIAQNALVEFLEWHWQQSAGSIDDSPPKRPAGTSRRTVRRGLWVGAIGLLCLGVGVLVAVLMRRPEERTERPASGEAAALSSDGFQALQSQLSTKADWVGETFISLTHPTGRYVSTEVRYTRVSDDKQTMDAGLMVCWKGLVKGAVSEKQYETEFVLSFDRQGLQRLAVERDSALFKIDPERLKRAESQLRESFGAKR